MPEQLLSAEWIRTPRGLEKGLAIEVSADGRIAAVAPLEGRVATRHFDGHALLPGFVNAHSHAFQRGLRGRGETFPRGAGSFWSWREAMYSLVGSLDADGLHAICVQAFSEMLDAGMTAVGEFHYLHHLHVDETSGGDFDGDFGGDRVVLEAAREVGIRLVLLEAYYARGGFDDRPLAGGQRRFATPDTADYWRQLDRLGALLDGPQELGVVAHSLRAVGRQALAELWRGARERGLVMHLHLEEQRLEIEDAKAAHGTTPMALLLDTLRAQPAAGDSSLAALTAVHCTHSRRQDLERFAAAGAAICLCPLTEANLGDGLADLAAMQEQGIGLSLGSDSNARISMLEEMRWLEYGQRLREEKRGAVQDAAGRVAPRLLGIASAGGAASLGLDAGRIEAGAWADLIAVDLRHPLLADPAGEDSPAEEAEAERIDAALVFGAAEQVIDAVAVGGRWLRGPRIG